MAFSISSANVPLSSHQLPFLPTEHWSTLQGCCLDFNKRMRVKQPEHEKELNKHAVLKKLDWRAYSTQHSLWNALPQGAGEASFSLRFIKKVLKTPLFDQLTAWELFLYLQLEWFCWLITVLELNCFDIIVTCFLCYTFICQLSTVQWKVEYNWKMNKWISKHKKGIARVDQDIIYPSSLQWPTRCFYEAHKQKMVAMDHLCCFPPQKLIFRDRLLLDMEVLLISMAHNYC